MSGEIPGDKTMADEKFELTRRKALAGLGTIGAASAGAGLGTTAFLNDVEGFDNNSITAGTLDMAVDGEIVAANQYWQDQNILGNPITADGEVEVGFELGDFKPGDWFIICFTVDAKEDSNPFYLTLHGDADKYREKEGANTEPENQEELGQPGQGSETTDNDWESVDVTNAELGDKLLISYWEQWNGTAPSQGTQSGGKSELARMDNISNTESNAYTSASSYSDPDEDGVVTSGTLGYTDAREFYFGLDQSENNAVSGNDPLGNGIASGDGVLVGGTSDPVEVGSDKQGEIDRNRMGNPDSDGEAELVFYLLFELPEEVGNEVQGDGVKGNLRFSAEQIRNNGDPRSDN